MRNTRTILSLVSIVLLTLFACQEEGSSDQSPEETDQTPDNLFVKDSATYSSFFKQVVAKDAGHFRGVSLGMHIAQVERLESTTEAERSEDYLRYALEFDLETSADVEYFFDKEKVKEIMISTYQGSPKDAQHFYDEIHDFLQEKLGGGLPKGDTLEWVIPEDSKYQLVKVGQEKVPGVVLTISYDVKAVR